MSFVAAHETPTLTYVGRLSDSRKGLTIFLDAIQLLWENEPGLGFNAWVIGGDEQERSRVRAAAVARPVLRSRVNSGQLRLWGKVETEALPEVYSRSFALVVPSLREQFGIVAAEAMMCGCPVVASRVGGLQDVVVDGRTGTLFESGNTGSLAAALLAYLRAPTLQRWHAENAHRWAMERFAISRVCSSFEALFAGRATVQDQSNEPSGRAFQASELERQVSVLEEALGDVASDYLDLTSSPAISARVSLNKLGSVFLKIYPRRPSYFSCLFPGQEVDRSEYERDVGRERLTLLRALRGQVFLPDIIFSDLKSRYVVQRWHQRVSFASCRKLFALARTVAEELQEFKAVTASPKAGRELFEELRRLSRFPVAAEIDTISTIDEIGAALTGHLLGSQPRSRRIHPQVELRRLRDCLVSNSYWLPVTYRLRAIAEIDFLLSLRPLIAQKPGFAHGTLKQEHFLSDSKLCDFDHAGYYCGPVDVAHCIWEYFREGDEPHSASMLFWLREVLKGGAEFFLGICWMLVFTINRDLVSFAQGRWHHQEAQSRFLLRWHDAVSGSISLSQEEPFARAERDTISPE